MRQILITLTAAFAVWPASAAEPPPASLTVKPVLCIVDERTPSCDLDFVIAWRALRLGYYCVLNDHDEEPMRCWADRQAGETTDRRELTESIEFRLEEGDAGILVASATVDVLRKDSDDRRRRRRTRYVWDVL